MRNWGDKKEREDKSQTLRINSFFSAFVIVVVVGFVVHLHFFVVLIDSLTECVEDKTDWKSTGRCLFYRTFHALALGGRGGKRGRKEGRKEGRSYARIFFR